MGSASVSISLSDVSVSVSLKSVESMRLYAGGLALNCCCTGRSNRFLCDCCLCVRSSGQVRLTVQTSDTHLNLDLTERLRSAAVRAKRRLKAAAPREKMPPTSMR